jgi:hypothetical protein
MLRWRLTMVVTAMTWSGSVAWRMPSRNPTPITVSKFTMCAIKETNRNYITRRQGTLDTFRRHSESPFSTAFSTVIFRTSFRSVFFFPKELVSLQHILLRNHAFELAEIGAAHNRKKRPAIHITQRRLQRIIGM